MAKPKADRKAKGEKPKAEMAFKIAPSEELDAIIKRYRGRPTKYDPAMCDVVVAWGLLGKSRTWMAAEMMVVRDTIDNWAKEHPEFLGALTLAKHLEQQYWEDKGDKLITTAGFAQNCWARNMAARFPQEWREKLALTDPDGGKLVIEFST